MKKEISTPIAIIAVLLLVVGGYFVFQNATGPLKSENPSPDVTKMTPAEIEKVKQLSNPDNLH